MEAPAAIVLFFGVSGAVVWGIVHVVLKRADRYEPPRCIPPEPVYGECDDE